MRGRDTSDSHEDMLLSRLYQQVTKWQEPRFGSEYDVASGLDRYKTWLHDHGVASGRNDLTGASSQRQAAPGAADTGAVDTGAADTGAVDTGAVDTGAVDTGAADTGAVDTGEQLEDCIEFPGPVAGDAVMPDDLLADATERTEWSADLAVMELYAQHYRALVRLAAMLVRDTSTAEEVVQDSFVAMHDGWHRLKDTEKALAYLRQAVVNKSRSVLRHRAVVEKNVQNAPPDMPSAEHGAFLLLERSAVIAALRDLPARQREAIVLRYYGNLSEAEIATTMGISRGAVKSHTSRGMAALRAVLEQE
jgi:RNA polymerase sigma-70 factor (sigma-E family)